MAETKLGVNQLGNDKKVWNEENLVSGENIKIQKHINPNVLDPKTTLAMYHFDGDYTDETTNQNTIIPNVNSDIPDGTFYSDSNTVKFINPDPSGIPWKSLRLTSNNYNWSRFNFTNAIPLGYSWTIDFWILLPDNYGDMEFIAGTDPLRGVMFQGGTGGNSAYVTFRCSRSYYKNFTLTKNMNDHVYHHLAIVMDNSVASIYVDGELNNTFDFGLNWSPLDINFFRSTGKNFASRFPYIDELRFSNIAMWDKNFPVPTKPYTFKSEEPYWELNTTGLAKLEDLSTVAITGAYSDLSGIPSLATVATSGSFNDLTDKPTIPSAPSDMTGATSSAAGTHGLVPAPAAGDNEKFLAGDGTWKEVGGNVPEGVYTQDNLVAGENIEFKEESNGVDSNTLNLYHLNTNLIDSITTNTISTLGRLVDDTYKFNNGSLYGNNNESESENIIPLTCLDNTAHYYWTLDFWYRSDTYNFGGQSSTGMDLYASNSSIFKINPNGNGFVGFWLGSWTADEFKALFSLNTWNHIAVVNNGGKELFVFINGYILKHFIYDENDNRTGVIYQNAVLKNFFTMGTNQWIDEVRFSDVARWTSDFSDKLPAKEYSEGNYKTINTTQDVLTNKTVYFSGGISGSANQDGSMTISGYPDVIQDLVATSVTISAQSEEGITPFYEGTVYQYGTLTSLTISSINVSNLASLIYFTTDSTSFTFTPPTSYQKIGDLTFEDGKKYVICIFNGIICRSEITDVAPVSE